MEHRSCYLIYDGDCPFCSAYVRLVRLRRLAGDVRLINARTPGAFLAVELPREFDLDEGMLLILDRKSFHGADAMNRIALLTGPSDVLNRAIY
jgi:predicted DCC family thiol-disulfide oxidoreductase YuxK